MPIVGVQSSNQTLGCNVLVNLVAVFLVELLFRAKYKVIGRINGLCQTPIIDNGKPNEIKENGQDNGSCQGQSRRTKESEFQGRGYKDNPRQELRRRKGTG